MDRNRAETRLGPLGGIDDPAAAAIALAPERFGERYELFLQRVARYVSLRPDCADRVQPLTARILEDTIDVWAGEASDLDAAVSVLLHARAVCNRADRSRCS